MTVVANNPDRRATGQTTRAVLKAARQVSQGKVMAIIGAQHTMARHFVEQVGDLLAHFGYPPSRIRPGLFEWPNGGALCIYSDRERARGARYYKEITEI